MTVGRADRRLAQGRDRLEDPVQPRFAVRREPGERGLSVLVQSP